jgi:predicted N-acetyltransferase YhbS
VCAHARFATLSSELDFLPDTGRHDAVVETLYARAFGPGRFAKAAARLREGNAYLCAQSMLAFDRDTLVGACRIWPIVDQYGQTALFLGPIAVDSGARGRGIGAKLVQACLNACQNETVILVGDLSFFGAQGFEIVPLGQLVMPGPVDPNRLLWRRGVNVPEGRLRARLVSLETRLRENQYQ